ncbi:DUF4439 domain-containing protein [Paenarthrobacter sp. NPDC089714]|uniref:DUF4439 domain-containing protein n=1 Tax=Paenarthrobacter sp. NPDC089714 TaxID=3364377 RepID=UPI00381022E8
MNEQTSEKRPPRRWVRIALVAIVALLVIGTGMVLVPRDSGAPAAVSFTEAARSSAFNDALALRDSASSLAASPSSGVGAGTWTGSVTLLTTHARALLSPVISGPSSPVSSSARAAEPTAPSFIADLAASGRKRLEDAKQADAGIARLLAAVGTAQVLDAERLASLLKLPFPTAGPDTKATAPAQARTPCPSVSPTPEPTAATTDAALAAAVRSEHQAVYVHQVALKRLDATAAVTAAKALTTHERLLEQAESLTRLTCGDVPNREAGYSLSTQFAGDPAAALGTLEIESLPVFGDLVALSTGPTREWAMESLLAAARRGAAWGSAQPPLPGLKLDDGDLPQLPTPASTPG